MYISILAALVAAVLVVSSPAPAETPAEVDGDPGAAEALRVETAIEHLTRGNAAHPLTRLPKRRIEMARLIASAAEAHQIPALLLTAIAFRESSLRTRVTGDLGERGLLQVHGIAAEGCDLETAEGQLDCGARWLRRCADRCGSLDGGFALYASGRTCKPDTKHLRSVVADRWRLWANLEKIAR